MYNVKFPWGVDYSNYMKKNYPKNTGIYDGLSDEQVVAIKSYFRWRTRQKFNEITNNMPFRVSKEKANRLTELAASADDWMFDGVVDLGSMIGKCDIGHALRYEYYAYSKSTDSRVIFGSTCVSDFFNVSKDVINKLNSVRTETFEDVKKMVYILKTDKMEKYKKLNYDTFPIPIMKGKNANELFENILGDGTIILFDIMKAKLPVPDFFIKKINIFIKHYGVQSKILKFTGGIEDKNLSDYINKLVVDIDYFKPNDYIHRKLRGGVIEGGEVKGMSEEQFINSLKLGLHVFNNRKSIATVTRFRLDLKYYERLYFIGRGKNKRAAYKNEIDTSTSNAYMEYANKLPDSTWENITSLIWVSTGDIRALKGCLPESRAYLYTINGLTEIPKIANKVIDGIKEVESIGDNFNSIVKEHREFIDETIRINNTISEDVDESDDSEKDELQIAWDYLNKNKGRVEHNGIINILNRYNSPSMLSEKQEKFVLGVARSMMRKDAKEKPVSDLKKAKRIVIFGDSGGKRYAIINCNEVCRVLKGRKFIGGSILGAVELVNEIERDINFEFVVDGNISKDIANGIVNSIRNNGENGYSDAVIDPDIVEIQSITGVVSGRDIIDKYKFTDKAMTKYAKSIFDEEGVVDEFLKDVTARFLEYRKIIREGYTKK